MQNNRLQLSRVSYTFFLILLAFYSAYGLKAQENITGTILDADTKCAIAFANVSIQGKAQGCTSNEAGSFVIRYNTDDDLKLVFSHINYQKQTIALNELTQTTKLKIYLQAKSQTLNKVIVTAALYGQAKNKLAKASAIIPQREIKEGFHSNMIDVLATTPGFTQVWEYHSPIILRGLNSKRLVILKNGSRRIGTFPGGYFAQDMNIFGIKKIEIVKGPGSVIYGSGAISGIINIIPPDPFGDRQLTSQVLSGYGSNNHEFLESVNLCHKTPKLGLQMNAKYRKTDHMVYGNKEIADNSNVEDRDLALGLSFRLSKQQTLRINADYHYGNWGKPRGFNGTSKQFTKIRNEEENLHSDVTYNYTPKRFFETLNLNLYLDKGKRDYFKYKYSEISGKVSSLDLVHYQDFYGGGRTYGLIKLYSKSMLTLGSDAFFFRLDNPTELVDYYNHTNGTLAGYKGAGQQDIGLFVRNETLLTEQVKLMGGLRYDYAEVYEGAHGTSTGRQEYRSAFSGNLGLVYSANDNTHLSCNAGRAFRMPTAEEMFTEVISCKGTKQGNPQLSPEYSWNIDLGLRGNSANTLWTYDLALFYNMLEDCITETASPLAGIDYTFKNTKALMYGGELSSSYLFQNILKQGNTLVSDLGMAYVYGIDQSNKDETPLFGIPPFNARLKLDYRGLINQLWLTGYAIKLQVNYAAAQNRVAQIPDGGEAGPWGYICSEDHTTLNLSFGLKSNVLPGHPKLHFIIQNLLDQNYRPFGSYIPAMGRNFKTTLSFTIK